MSFIISEDILRHMYWVENMSMENIGREFGVSRKTIFNRMAYYRIKSRTHSESMLGDSVKPSKKELYKMYRDEEMSLINIAKISGVSSTTILRWMHEYGISSRDVSDSHIGNSIKPSEEKLRRMYCDEKMTFKEIAEVVGVSSTTISIWAKKYSIESRNHLESNLVNSSKPSKEKLCEMYLDNEISIKKISIMIGVSPGIVLKWMRKYGIESRTSFDFVGEKSGGWKGGIAGRGYCYKFNNIFKEAVRERDDYTCQLCGSEQIGEKLSVHHIHYDKENCYPDVVALCRSCNSKVNGNRDYWEKYFENLLIDKGLFCWSMT